MSLCKIPFLLLIHLLFAAISVDSYSQEKLFQGAVSARKVGINDSFNVSYKYSGTEIATLKTNFDSFDIVRGLMQSSSIKGESDATGKMNYDTSYSFTYTLKARKTGNCIIGKASAITKSGTTVYANEISIEVVEQHIVNAPSQDPFGTGGSFFDKQMERFKAEQAETDKIYADLTESKLSYLVAYGPIYSRYSGDSKGVDTTKQAHVLTELDNFFARREETKPLGTYKWKQINNVRKYAAVADTTGIREQLEKVYSQDKDSRYRTVIATPRTWKRYTELNRFNTEASFYNKLDQLHQRIQELKYNPADTKKIVACFWFQKAKEREAFIASIAGLNCTFTDTTTTNRDFTPLTHYKANFYKEMKLGYDDIENFGNTIFMLADKQNGNFEDLGLIKH